MKKTIKVTAQFDGLRHEDGYEVVDRIINAFYDELHPLCGDDVVEFELVVKKVKKVTDEFLDIDSEGDEFVNYSGVEAIEVK